MVGRKKELLDKIESINDKDIIDEIYRLLEIDFDDTIYTTNEDQKNAITEARKQINQGRTLSDKKANEKIDEWLKGKE